MIFRILMMQFGKMILTSYSVIPAQICIMDQVDKNLFEIKHRQFGLWNLMCDLNVILSTDNDIANDNTGRNNLISFITNNVNIVIVIGYFN